MCTQETALNLGHPIDFLLQGTLYPDVIESISYKVSHTIWSYSVLTSPRVYLWEGPLRHYKDASQRGRLASLLEAAAH